MQAADRKYWYQSAHWHDVRGQIGVLQCAHPESRAGVGLNELEELNQNFLTSLNCNF